MELGEKLLGSLLDDDDLDRESEEVAFKSVLRWMRQGGTAGAVRGGGLMCKIRFPFMSPGYLENDARAELLKIEGLDRLDALIRQALWLKRLDCPPWDQVRLKHLDACALTPRRAGGTIRWGRYAKGGEFRVSFCYKIQICSFCLLGERFVFAGLQDGSIFIMCRSTLKVLGTLNGHTRAVLVMVSVGEILISSSEDGDIRAWDISSDSRLGPNSCKWVLQANHGGLTCLAVAGNRLMSGGHDWSACVWRVTGQGAEWSRRLDFELDQHCRVLSRWSRLKTSS
jgi:hypothetical protein